MLSLHMFAEKTCFRIKLHWKVLYFFSHIFGILNSFSNPCTSEVIYCHFLVIFKGVLQVHLSCSGLITESLREMLTSAVSFPALKCFDTLLARQGLYLLEIKELATFLTLNLTGEAYSFSCEISCEIKWQFRKNFYHKIFSSRLLFRISLLHFYFFQI